MRKIKIIVLIMMTLTIINNVDASSIQTASKIKNDNLILDIYMIADKSFSTVVLPITYDKETLSLEWDEKDGVYKVDIDDNFMGAYIKRLVLSASKELKSGKYKLSTFTFKIKNMDKLDNTYIIISDGEYVSGKKEYTVTGTAVKIENENDTIFTSSEKMDAEIISLVNTYNDSNTINDSEVKKLDNVIQQSESIKTNTDVDAPHTGVGLPIILLTALILCFSIINIRYKKSKVVFKI